MSLLVWVFLGLGETVFLGAGVGDFCVACGSGDGVVFWVSVEGDGAVLFLVTRTGSLGTGVVSFGSLSVSSAFLGVSLSSPPSHRLPYLADFPPLRTLL